MEGRMTGPSVALSDAEVLERAGWTRRFTAFGRRLAEVSTLYQQLGYEVRLEPVESGAEEAPNGEACSQCFVMTLAQTIYTRPTYGENTAEEE
jgi:hypothetical protein